MPKGIASVLFLLLALAALPASAREEKSKATCLDDESALEERVLACTRYLRGGQPTPEEQVAALQARARAYRDLDRFAESLADIDAALALQPDNDDLHRERGTTCAWMDDHACAVVSYQRAIELNPDYAWTYYALGFSLARLDRFDEALAAYDRALALRPGFADVLDARGNLHMQRGEEAAAIADFTATLALDPYRPFTYVKRGELLAVFGTPAEALRDYRLALLLDPNQVRADWGIERLGVPPELSLPLEARPFTVAPPPVGLTIDYLQLEVLPEVVRDPMEEAIGDLVGWFKEPEPLPLPLASLFVTRQVQAIEGRETALAITLSYPDVDDADELLERAVGHIDGLWPSSFPTPKGAGASIGYDLEALAKIWTLTPGESSSGAGTIFVACPAEGTPPDVLAALVGCQPGQTVQIGSLTWTATLEGWEDVLVPVGRHAALKLRYVEDAEMTVMGQTRQRTAVTTWWWSPEIGWWIKRRHEKDGKIEVSEAVRIVPPP